MQFIANTLLINVSMYKLRINEQRAYKTVRFINYEIYSL